MPHDSNIITIYQSRAGKIFIQAPMREQQALDIASLIKEGILWCLIWNDAAQWNPKNCWILYLGRPMPESIK